jgi:hypothetical protein
MSTRSRIGILNDDGTVDSIYCHFDGYVTGIGQILQQHYTDPAKVNELIALGDISSLAPEIGVQHPFDNPHRYDTPEYKAFDAQYRGMVNAYGRDRGEDGVDAVHSATVEEFRAIDCCAEYYYLFCDGEWLVCCVYGDNPDLFENLEDAIAREAAEEAA